MEDAQNGAKHVGRTERLRTHTLEIEFELGIRIIGLQLRGEPPGQCGLPGPAHAAHAGDGYAALLHFLPQLIKLRLATSEVRDRRGELVQGVERRGEGNANVTWPVDGGN